MKNGDNKKLSQTLMFLGGMPNTKGFHYLKEGIRYCISDPRSVMNMKKLLYPKVADTFETTPAAVERALRTAINGSWHRRDRELAHQIFRNAVQSDADTPTSSLYIAAVAEWLNDEE